MPINLRGNADSDFSNGIDSDGNIEGDIFIGTTADDGADSSAFVTRQNGANRFQVTGGGTVRIGGTIPGAPNIELDADGSAEFGDFTSNTAAAVFLNDGAVQAFRSSAANPATSAVFLGGRKNGTGTDTNVELFADGSATFASRLTAGSTNASGITHFITSAHNDSQGSLLIQNASTAEAAPAAQLRVGAGSNATSNKFLNFSRDNGTVTAGAIVANGVNAAAFGTFSDKRLKEEITELPSQWENIKALKPSQFKFIDDPDRTTEKGFIAQEFQEVYPEFVALSPHPIPVAQRKDPDVEETVDRLMLGGWSKTDAYLVKALQECMTRIETLESRLSTLEGGNT